MERQSPQALRGNRYEIAPGDEDVSRDREDRLPVRGHDDDEQGNDEARNQQRVVGISAVVRQPCRSHDEHDSLGGVGDRGDSVRGKDGQSDEDRREQTSARTALEALLKQQTDLHTRQERIVLLLADMERLERESETAEAAERQAAAWVRETDLRAALETWAEAAERGTEFSLETTVAGSLAARIREARAELEAAEQAVQRDAHRAFPGYGLLALGVMAGIAGAAAGQVVPAIVLAIVCIVLGSVLTVRGQMAIRTAQERANAAQLAFATLEGERKSTEAQAQSNNVQRGLWTERERLAREALNRLEMPVPSTPAAARVQAQTLTALTAADARTAHRVAADESSKMCGKHEVARQTKESEDDLLRQTDPAALAARVNQAQVTMDRLKAALATADTLPNLALKLGVEADMTTMNPCLEQARKAMSVAEEHETSITGLKSEHEAKREDVHRALEQGRAFAEGLGFSSAGLADWRAAAEAEREDLRLRKTLTPNTLLELVVETAQQAILTEERRQAGLEAEQARRHETLQARPRTAIVGDQAVLAGSLATVKQQIEPLHNLRPTLEQQGLPSEAHTLHLHLAALSETIRHEMETAAQLPTARQEQELRQMAVATQQAEFQRAWQASLPSPVPDATFAVQQALPRLQAEYDHRLVEQDEPALQTEEKTLHAEVTGLGNAIATLQHRHEEAIRQQHSLRQELGMETAETIKTLPERLPDLVRAAEHTADAWETKFDDSKEALTSNRIQRQAQAQLYSVGEEALVLPTVETELATAEQEIAVKKRAGDIIEQTRQALIARVMPLTMQNVAQLLPLLTDGRYGDVKWDEASSSLEVYDTRARSYQRKRIFSGGARDQISLALRLGFALATLPGEHNIRPGWLFLDEPLSSFDRVRTLALVDLLTKGLIRRKFDQIFLVSHSEAFDPTLFDHRVRMESGSVIESNLPEALAV